MTKLLEMKKKMDEILSAVLAMSIVVLGVYYTTKYVTIAIFKVIEFVCDIAFRLFGIESEKDSEIED